MAAMEVLEVSITTNAVMAAREGGMVPLMREELTLRMARLESADSSAGSVPLTLVLEAASSESAVRAEYATCVHGWWIASGMA